MRDWQYGDHGENFAHLIGFGVMLVLLVILAVWVVRQLTGPGDHGRTGTHSPLEVLDQRFARGEIPLEDYTRDREALKKALRDK